jgi:hypothetical protein
MTEKNCSVKSFSCKVFAVQHCRAIAGWKAIESWKRIDERPPILCIEMLYTFHLLPGVDEDMTIDCLDDEHLRE